jgi:hypothetical protein
VISKDLCLTYHPYLLSGFPDQQDTIRIPDGGSLDAMGWPWLAPNFQNDSALADFSVNDKEKLGWIFDGVCASNHSCCLEN